VKLFYLHTCFIIIIISGFIKCDDALYLPGVCVCHIIAV